MSAGISPKLPQSVQAHVLRFCQVADVPSASRAQLISKKAYPLWVQAMIANVSGVSPQSWVGKQVIRLGFKKWDPTEPLWQQAQRLKIFVRSLASMLSPLQTILPDAERLGDFPKTLREQNPQPLIALGNRVAMRQEQNLSDLVGWLRGHHATSERALKKLEEQDSAEGRQALIQAALKSDREEILDAPADERHFLLQLGSFPPEAIQLNIHPTLLAKLVQRFCGHVPFVKALMASGKNEQVGQEIILSALGQAVIGGEVELVRLFLRDRRLDGDRISEGGFKIACIRPNTPNRLQILRAFRADPRITADMEGGALAIVQRAQNLTQPEWFLVVRFLESRPGLLATAVELALETATYYPIQLPIASRLERIRHFLANPVITPKVREKILYWIAIANLPHDEWLQVIHALQAGAPIQNEFQDETLKVVSFLDNHFPIAARLFRMQYLLANPHLSLESFKMALETVAGSSMADAEWLQVVQLLESNARVTSAMLAGALHRAWGSVPAVRSRNISRFLNHPRLDQAGRAEALQWFNYRIADLSQPELEEALDLYLSHPQTTDRVRQDGLYSFLSYDHPVPDQARVLQTLNFILDHPQTTSSTLWRFLPTLFMGTIKSHSEHRAMLHAIGTHPKASQMPRLARLALSCERFWASVTASFPDSGWVRGVMEGVVAGVLFPLTIFRILAHGLLHFVSRLV